jgi:hypothetical protein
MRFGFPGRIFGGERGIDEAASLRRAPPEPQHACTRQTTTPAHTPSDARRSNACAGPHPCRPGRGNRRCRPSPELATRRRRAARCGGRGGRGGGGGGGARARVRRGRRAGGPPRARRARRARAALRRPARAHARRRCPPPAWGSPRRPPAPLARRRPRSRGARGVGRAPPYARGERRDGLALHQGGHAGVPQHQIGGAGILREETALVCSFV